MRCTLCFVCVVIRHISYVVFMTYNMIPLAFNAYLHTYQRQSLDYQSFKRQSPDAVESDDSHDKNEKQATNKRYCTLWCIIV